MLAKLKQELKNFYPYAKKRLGFNRPVRLFLRQDVNNAADVYGKTAYYDPQEEKVVLYVTDRHPKDILRSFAHELVHHKQNCEGRLSALTAGEGYAQTELGDQLEIEAYKGSKLVRDYEDTQLNEQQTENLRRNQMTTEELKQKVEDIVNEYLAEKKGIKNPGKYMGGERQKAGVDDDGDGVPNKADKDPKDGDVKEGKLDEYGADPNAGTPFASTPGGYVEDWVADLHRKKKKKAKDENKEEKVEEKYDDEIAAARSLGKEVSKRMKDKEKKKDKEELKESKQEEKQIMTETPQPKQEQDNDTWYWGSLYNKLKDKWAK